MKVCIRNIILLAITLAVVGCSDENDYPLKGKLDDFTTADGKNIKVRNDTACIFPTDEIELFATDIANENDIEVLKRYTDSKTEGYWIRAKFGGWCEKIGLDSNKEYIIRREYYYQAIADKPGWFACPFVPDNKHMGLIERGDGTFAIGYTGGPTAYWDEPGIIGNCKTMIIHIGYDADGNTVDKYFPCMPADLEWHYSWLELDFNN